MDWKDTGISVLEFVAKTQFLSKKCVQLFLTFKIEFNNLQKNLRSEEKLQETQISLINGFL